MSLLISIHNSKTSNLVIITLHTFIAFIYHIPVPMLKWQNDLVELFIIFTQLLNFIRFLIVSELTELALISTNNNENTGELNNSSNIT